MQCYSCMAPPPPRPRLRRAIQYSFEHQERPMQAPLSRRRFLQASAAIATSAFPILGANDKIQLGIVGLGGRGNDHIGFYSTLDAESRMVAVCDVNQAARERAVARIQKAKGNTPKDYPDMR